MNKDALLTSTPLNLDQAKDFKKISVELIIDADSDLAAMGVVMDSVRKMKELGASIVTISSMTKVY